MRKRASCVSNRLPASNGCGYHWLARQVQLFFLPSYKKSCFSLFFPLLSSLTNKTKSHQPSSPIFKFKSASRALSYPLPPRSSQDPTASPSSIYPISPASHVRDIKMSAAVDQVTETMAAATLSDPVTTNANGESNNAQIDAVNAIVAEGRRLYIGNLAYATTEGDLNEFFKGFLVLVALLAGFFHLLLHRVELRNIISD